MLYEMKDELGWGGTLYPGVKSPRGHDTMPTVSCPQGQDKLWGDILPRGKVFPGTRYHVVSYPGTRYCGDKINWYTGLNQCNKDNSWTENISVKFSSRKGPTV